MARLIGIVLLLASWVWAQEGGVYTVDNYQGGVNVATDGTNLRPDEALVMTNLTLDSVNCLVPRQGFSYLDSAAIDASKEIRAIYIYEPYPDTLRMIIVTDGFIYITLNLNDPGDVDWDTLRLSFTDDSLKVMEGNTRIERPSPSWWYSKVLGGNKISMVGDTSNTEYVIYYVWDDNETRITLLSTYNGANADTTTFTIYLRMPSTTAIIPCLIQYSDKLFIANDGYFTTIYDDTSYSFVALLDSGTIDVAINLNDTVTVYSTGKAKVKYHENKVYGNSDVVWQASWADSSWEFEIRAEYYGPGDRTIVNWSSKIIDVDSTERVLTLENAYPRATPTVTWNDYEIKTIYYMCVLDSGLAVTDSNKNWMDIELGANYLLGLRAVFGPFTYGVSDSRIIGCNSDIAFSIPKIGSSDSITSGTPYYIFAGGLPYGFQPHETDDTRMEYPRFRQVAFYNNQLFGLGYRKLAGNYSTVVRADHDVVWYSHPSMPRYSPALDYNFSLGKTEINTTFLPMRNNLYIGTENSIWGYSGIMNESLLRRVVSDNGIPDYDNWVKATEEYSYFANRTGVYRFDGVRPQKISWDIDPIIQKNYGSRIVMGYFSAEQKLFLSFPDSNITYFYDERFGDRNVWVGPWDFGMTCFYAPPDANIFYFGHSEFKGRVYYYPNGLYQDFVAIDDTNDITIAYESGWQPYGGYWKLKRIAGGVNWDAYFQVKNSNSVTIKLYTNNDNGDFNTVACDTILCDSTGRFVYRKQLDNDCVGEYFKVAFNGTIDALAIFGGYRIEWVEEPEWQK